MQSVRISMRLSAHALSFSQRPYLLAVLVSAALLLGLSSRAFAQIEGTGSLTSGQSDSVAKAGASTDTPYYIPGMPMPKATGEEGAAAGATSKSGGKIGKVSTVDRSGKNDKTEGIDRASLKVGDMYRGIVPGIKDWHVFARKARDAAKKNGKARNRLTWIGYQDMDSGTRVFLQTIKAATYDVAESVGSDGLPTLEISLIGTRIPVYNNRRTLDTSYFQSAVIGAKAKPSGKGTLVTITLQNKTSYKVHQEAEFLFVDFDDAGAASYADLLAEKKRAEKAAAEKQSTP